MSEVARIDAERDADVVHLLRRADRAVIELPGVQDLAAQRHDRLEVLLAGLLGRAAGRVALDQEELGAARVVAGAVGELAGQRRTARDALALHLLRGLEALLGVVDRVLGDLLAGIRMLREPQAEVVLDEALDQARGIARGQALLGLARELRLADLDREHVARAVPDVLGRELHAARQQVAELAELAHRGGRARHAGR
jgi:hypothetical protein